MKLREKCLKIWMKMKKIKNKVPKAKAQKITRVAAHQARVIKMKNLAVKNERLKT